MSRKLSILALITLFIFLLTSLASPALAQDDSSTFAVEIPKTTTLPWYVAVIFFVVVAVGVTILKERLNAGRKKPIITTTTCAPLVEDSTQPFKDQQS